MGKRRTRTPTADLRSCTGPYGFCAILVRSKGSANTGDMFGDTFSSVEAEVAMVDNGIVLEEKCQPALFGPCSQGKMILMDLGVEESLLGSFYSIDSNSGHTRCPKESKAGTGTDRHLYTGVHRALLTVTNKWKQSKCLLISKHNRVYIYDGILFSLKREEIVNHVTTWTNTEVIMLSGENCVTKSAGAV